MIITPSDYDEMHYKILECYFIHPLPKDTLKVKSTNGVLTMKNQWWNTKLPTKINYCKEKSHDYLLENSHQYTLCEAIIKDDTHDKYKTAKKFFNHNKTKIWLQSVYRMCSLIYMVLIFQKGYLQAWMSSIHSSKNIHMARETRLKNVCFMENYDTVYTSEENFRIEII